jgi:GNAT superfamily N-acetyltransferase
MSSKAPIPPITARHRYSISDGKGDPIAHVEVYEVDGVLWLTDLWTAPEHRGKGYAGALMARAVGAWQGSDLYLSVQPYTDQPLDASQLRAWYGAYFGFQPTEVPGVLRRAAGPWVGGEGAR